MSVLPARERIILSVDALQAYHESLRADGVTSTFAFSG